MLGRAAGAAHLCCLLNKVAAVVAVSDAALQPRRSVRFVVVRTRRYALQCVDTVRVHSVYAALTRIHALVGTQIWV